MITIRKFAMQCNGYQEQVWEMAQACDDQRTRAAQARRSPAANDETVHRVRRGTSEDATHWIARAVAELGGLNVG